MMFRYTVAELAEFTNYCRAHGLRFANRWEMMNAIDYYYHQ